MEHEQEIAYVTLGILGNIATTTFLLSSVPTVLRIIKQRTLDGLSCDLCIFKLFNCLLWTVYGLPIVHPHNFWVLLTNSIGCFLSLIYIASYIHVGSERERWSIVWKLVTLSSAFIIIVLVLLLVDHRRHVRIMVIGILCVTVSSCMHLTLLSQLRMTLKTKKSKYMHPKASVAAFLKGVIWTAYGIVNVDVFIVIPNGVGIATGFLQLLVAIYMFLEKRKSKQEQIIPEFISSTNQKSIEEQLPKLKIAVTVEDREDSTTIKDDREFQHSVGRVLSSLQVRGVVVPINRLD